MKLIYTLALLCLFLLGCQSQQKVLNSWLNHNKQEIYQSWGPPDRITEDGGSGQILIYAKHLYAPNINVNTWEYKMLYVNSDGTIYRWLLKREPVAPTQIDVRFLN